MKRVIINYISIIIRNI